MVWRLVLRRTLLGLLTLLVVSILVFFATHVLPGNAANAVLGQSATPKRVEVLEAQLELNRPVVDQYLSWLGNLLTGHLGHSLSGDTLTGGGGQPVWELISPKLVNSAILVFLSGLIGSVLGVLLGILATLRRESWFDRITSVGALTVTALPEFIVAVVLVILFATGGLQILPAVSTLPPGTYAWSEPELLVLPVATLVIVIVPYIFRMTRAAMTEALESDYVEMAKLNGVPTWRINLFHALPNIVPPVIQVIGLNFLYLAGGIVLVEFVFNYPGIGQGLVSSITQRDIPVIQVIVVILAAFYVAMNIVTDVIALLASPRRRVAR
ncbi:MAG: ABC transporter permease [Actinobacteria bacterium]|nr:ABC transporter permease [Actinomycetota bacterium]